MAEKWVYEITHVEKTLCDFLKVNQQVTVQTAVDTMMEIRLPGQWLPGFGRLESGIRLFPQFVGVILIDDGDWHWIRTYRVLWDNAPDEVRRYRKGDDTYYYYGGIGPIKTGFRMKDAVNHNGSWHGSGK